MDSDQQTFLFEANKKLGIKDDINILKNKNIIFVYSSAKCGSTSLVSSLRLSCFEQFTVVHLHNDTMLKIMYKIHNVTIKDIIEFNRSLNKNVYVFDIFREPIEHKMSLYFEILDTFHFNVNTTDIKTLTLEKIIKRFNDVFPHIVYLDYFESVYEFQTPPLIVPFDFEKGYIHYKDSNGINYIKLRLRDADTKWSTILSQLFRNNIWVVKDNVMASSAKRPLYKFYEQFKKSYRLPMNFFEELKSSSSSVLDSYLSPEEKEAYFQKWEISSLATEFKAFTDEQYRLYVEISRENKHISQCHLNHYIDNGCECATCWERRKELRQKLLKPLPLQHQPQQLQHQPQQLQHPQHQPQQLQHQPQQLHPQHHLQLQLPQHQPQLQSKSLKQINQTQQQTFEQPPEPKRKLALSFL